MRFSDRQEILSQPSAISCWTECLDPDNWDAALASFVGHPLQTTLWGNARNKIDGVSQLLLEYRSGAGAITGLARVELRTIPLLGKIAWLPKGPVLPGDEAGIAEASLHAELKRRGFIVCIADRYVVSQTPHSQSPRTIWLDLTLGVDVLSKNLDPQWRSRTRRALREGVIVCTTENPDDVSIFFHMCYAMSERKEFPLPGSEALMQELLSAKSTDQNTRMMLYIGKVNGVIAGGVLVARCGQYLHYFWGATNHDYSKYRVSEAIHWQIIQDGVAAGMTRYDLEGIDPVGNPGVYQFKRKMGGTEVALQGKEVMPLTLTGRLAVNVGRRLGRF